MCKVINSKIENLIANAPNDDCQVNHVVLAIIAFVIDTYAEDRPAYQTALEACLASLEMPKDEASKIADDLEANINDADSSEYSYFMSAICNWLRREISNLCQAIDDCIKGQVECMIRDESNPKMISELRTQLIEVVAESQFDMLNGAING